MKITDNVYNSVTVGGATSIYGKTIETNKGTDTYYLTTNAEKELLVGFKNSSTTTISWEKYVSNSDYREIITYGDYHAAGVKIPYKSGIPSEFRPLVFVATIDSAYECIGTYKGPNTQGIVFSAGVLKINWDSDGIVIAANPSNIYLKDIWQIV